MAAPLLPLAVRGIELPDQLRDTGRALSLRGLMQQQQIDSMQMRAYQEQQAREAQIDAIIDNSPMDPMQKALLKSPAGKKALAERLFAKGEPDKFLGYDNVVGPDGKPMAVEKWSSGPKPSPFAPYEKPPTAKEDDLAAVLRAEGVVEGSPEWRQAFSARRGKLTTHAPAASASATVMTPRENFKDETVLRKEHEDASKTFAKLAEGYGKVKNSISSSTISAPSTLAAATQFMKLLDPDSVVRESELSMALNSAGMWDRFMNLYQIAKSGKVFTPAQAAEVERVADIVYGAAAQRQAQRDSEYTNLARQYGFDPNRVVRKYGYEPPKVKPTEISDDGNAVTVDGITYQVISRNQDGSIRIKDPKTGRTGTVRP